MAISWSNRRPRAHSRSSFWPALDTCGLQIRITACRLVWSHCACQLHWRVWRHASLLVVPVDHGLELWCLCNWHNSVSHPQWLAVKSHTYRCWHGMRCDKRLDLDQNSGPFLLSNLMIHIGLLVHVHSFTRNTTSYESTICMLNTRVRKRLHAHRHTINITSLNGTGCILECKDCTLITNARPPTRMHMHTRITWNSCSLHPPYYPKRFWAERDDGLVPLHTEVERWSLHRYT